MSQRIHWSVDGTVGYYGTSSTKTALSSTQRAQMDDAPTPPWFSSWGGIMVYSYGTQMLNFPTQISLDRVAVGGSFTLTSVKVSNDSTDGFDGTWTTVWSGSQAVGLSAMCEISFSPTACTWVKITATGSVNQNIHKFFVFGTYDTQQFEFWDAGETTEFTANYPLTFADAANQADYNQTLTFKLKNTDTVAHSYSLAFEAVKYGGDIEVTDHITIDTTTITSLGTGSFSSAITVTANYPVAHNPADGTHWFRIKVTETA